MEDLITDTDRQRELLQGYWEGERLVWLGSITQHGRTSYEARTSLARMDEYLDTAIDMGLIEQA